MTDRKVTIFGIVSRTKLPENKITFDSSDKFNTNFEITKSFARETVNRDYGFADNIRKLDLYGNFKSNQYKVEKDIIESKIIDQVQAIFKEEYERMLNRGFSQKNAKHFALQEARKYRDEELSYWNKKMLL